MARETLFDGRYRYDHIYPRGRSGEALRAYDTQHADRLVVIKRPAPQDAPPIRAGQEVNIRTERRALQQLQGHPVLAELLEEGAFRVGGQSHLYIVLERAEGVMIEEEVLRLAADDEYLPELELLTIVDSLLDLLSTAHKHDIVYNDVDAKHLFWQRENHQLKVIDWGNAVFLEGDTVTPQGISRQSDVYQVGELLYFILTGGQRVVAGDAGVDFGEHASRIPTRMQHIIQRAVHPALEQRYPDIDSLREDLAQYRLPLEKDRSSRLERVERRLGRECSQRELEQLHEDLTTVLSNDPGYPPARALFSRVTHGLNRLAVLADLDAVRIYVEDGNWQRAAELLAEVLPRAEGAERTRTLLLLDAVRLAQEADLRSVPAGFVDVVAALYADRYNEAARLLLTALDEDREAARDMQWLLAERVQAHVPEVVVLRPHLLRIQQIMDSASEVYDWQEERVALDAAEESLGRVSAGTLEQVTSGYQMAAQQLGELAGMLERQYGTSGEAPPALVARAARQAAGASQAVYVQLQTVSAQASAAPEAARAALLEAILLDPVNPVFDRIEGILDNLQRLVERLEGYRPQADGADIQRWLQDSSAALQPYVEQLGDPRLGMFIGSMQVAGRDWTQFQKALVVGNRAGAVDAAQRVADALRKLNPDLVVWISNVRDIVQRARYVQRHTHNAAFGRAMADGWMAWDRGSGIEAERLGKQALEQVTSDLEAEAADRLIRLGRFLRTWQAGHGEGDPELTAQVDSALLGMLTPEEDRHWQQFTEQMQSPGAYLQAMESDLVAHFEATSTPAQRILFFHFVLRGVLEMYDEHPDDAEFWQQAAAKALPDSEQHIAYMALRNVMRDRRAVNALVTDIEAIETVADVVTVRKQLDRSPFQLLLKPTLEALRLIEKGAQDWKDGSFREAGLAFEKALDGIDAGERLGHVKLARFRAWLERLNQVAAELHVVRQRISESAEQVADEPDSRLVDWFERLAEDTRLFLSDEYAGRFVDWRDTYTAFEAVVTDAARRRSRKLRDIDEITRRANRIDLHPTYPLYRHWRSEIDAAPEYPAPPTDQPVPEYTDEVHPVWREDPDRMARRRGMIRRVALVGVLLVAVLGGLGVLIALSGDNGEAGEIAVTWETVTSTPGTQVAAAATETAAALALETLSAEITAAAAADLATGTAVAMALELSLTPTLPPTDTPVSEASATPTPSPTEPPSATPVPATIVIVTSAPTTAPADTTGNVTAAPVMVSDPVRGQQNVLLALEQGGQIFPWPQAWFRPGELGGNWVLGVPDLNGGDDLLQIVLPADLLAQHFGPEAAARLRRIEATLTLRDYNGALVSDGMVYFGLGLQGADESRVAAQALLVRADAMNVGARVGNEFRARTTLPINNATVSFALERYNDGTVGLFLDGESLGAPRFLTAPNAPVTPFLFVQNGGVVITVTDLVAQFD